MEKKRPLKAKLFPWASRKPLLEMAAKYGKRKYILVAVWEYMFWRSGQGHVFELPITLVVLDTGWDKDTLRIARNILCAEGWLRKEERRSPKGIKEVTRWVVIAKNSKSNNPQTPPEFTNETGINTDQPALDQPALDQPVLVQPAPEQATTVATSTGAIGHSVKEQLSDAKAITNSSDAKAIPISDAKALDQVSKEATKQQPPLPSVGADGSAVGLKENSLPVWIPNEELHKWEDDKDKSWEDLVNNLGGCWLEYTDGKFFAGDEADMAQELISLHGYKEVKQVMEDVVTNNPAKSRGKVIEWTDFRVFGRNFDTNRRKSKTYHIVMEAKAKRTSVDKPPIPPSPLVKQEVETFNGFNHEDED